MSWALKEKRPYTPQELKKLFGNNTMLGLMLQKTYLEIGSLILHVYPSYYHLKNQYFRLMNKSKIGSTCGSLQKMIRFFKAVFGCCGKDGRRFPAANNGQYCKTLTFLTNHKHGLTGHMYCVPNKKTCCNSPIIISIYLCDCERSQFYQNEL